MLSNAKAEMCFQKQAFTYPLTKFLEEYLQKINFFDNLFNENCNFIKYNNFTPFQVFFRYFSIKTNIYF